MTTQSPLCSVCNDIFTRRDVTLFFQKMQPFLPGVMVPIESIWFQEESDHHHRTSESFYEALHIKCYICTIVWHHLPPEKRAALANKVWNLEWSLAGTPANAGFVVLRIDQFGISVDFHLTPCKVLRRKYLSSITPAPSTSSLSTLGLGYNWYLSCRSGHKSCQRLVKDPKWYPTRLLDVGVPGDLTWKLHIYAEETMRSPNYMTLSYRWGSLPTVELTRSNVDELRRGKSIAELPRTFQDAVAVTRRFSVRYLWIDRLCIIQDSQGDWERESSTMCDVYANSSCNISATASTDPSGGLFRTREMNLIQAGTVTINADSAENKYYIVDQGYTDRHVSNTPLMKRGWVFQERLLAPRVLHFGEHQIFWECFMEQKCEGFREGLPFYRPQKYIDGIFDPRPSPSSKTIGLSPTAFEFWQGVITRYTKCALTKPQDKLVALSGLAHLFQEATGDDYLAGIWRSRLAEFLEWYAGRPMSKPSSGYLAPSWSWACGIGDVSMNVHGLRSDLISVLDARTYNSSSDCTGAVSGGFITLRGLMVQATCESFLKSGSSCRLKLETVPADTIGGRELDLGKFDQQSLPLTLIQNTDPRFIQAHLYPDFEGTSFSNSQHFHYLVVSALPFLREGQNGFFFELGGLILKRLPDRSELFIRIGYFKFSGSKDIERLGVCTNTESGSAYLSENVQPTVVTIV